MFLTRQSVRQYCFSCQRNSSETAQLNYVSATPMKPLNRIPETL